MSDQQPAYTVADIMRTDVPVARPTDSVGRVARLIAEHRVPGLPVVTEDGEIIGIITEGDIVERDAEVSFPSFFTFFDAVIEVDAGSPITDDLRHVLATNAEELMSSPVYNILPSASLQELATLMIQENVNPVPVVNDDLDLIGLLSRADLVRMVAKLESAAEEASSAPPSPTPPAP